MEFNKNIFNNSEEKWNFVISLIVICFFTSLVFFLFPKKNTSEKVNSSLRQQEGHIKTEVTTPETKHKTNKSTEITGKVHKTVMYKENSYFNEFDSAMVISDLNVIDKEDKSQTVLKESTTDLETRHDTLKNTTKSTENTYTKSFEENILDSSIAVKEILLEDSSYRKNLSGQEDSVSKNTLLEKKGVESEQTTSDKVVIEKPNLEETALISNDCILVVGVFKDINNANHVKEKLKELSYDYLDEKLKNGLHYVGVPVACDSKIETIQKEINQSFDIQSWLMKK